MAGGMQVVTCVVMLVVTCVVVTVTRAAPLDNHHDVKKSYPTETGVDEEVRQLLNLKSLSDQRNHQKQQQQQQQQQQEEKKKQQEKEEEEHEQQERDNGPAIADLTSSASVSAGDDEGRRGSGLLRHTLGELQRHQDQGHLTPHSRHQMEMEMPNEGLLHEGLLDEDEGRTPPHLTLGHRTPFRYSPLDLALYIYNTGDEESVVMAMLDLVTEGIMTTESAQEFIFDIYENLDHLRNQAAQNKDFPSEFKSLVKKNEMALPLSELYPGGDNPSDLMMGGAGGIGGPEADYESMMERVRGGGSGGIGGGMSQDYASYTQYSLEEVIYQLAKILFKQAMHREGDLGSERALQEVAALLEKEVARGAITPEVEKKVLDVMVNSLVDSLGESEFPSAPGPMIGGNNMRLTNEEASSSYPMGSSSSSTGIGGGSHFNKPSTDLFRLSKSTTKREAQEGEKKTDNKTV